MSRINFLYDIDFTLHYVTLCGGHWILSAYHELVPFWVNRFGTQFGPL